MRHCAPVSRSKVNVTSSHRLMYASSSFEKQNPVSVSLYKRAKAYRVGRTRRPHSLLILFHSRTILNMLALKQSAERWPFSAGGGSSDPPPLATGLMYWCRSSLIVLVYHTVFSLMEAGSQIQANISRVDTRFYVTGTRFTEVLGDVYATNSLARTTIMTSLLGLLSRCMSWSWWMKLVSFTQGRIQKFSLHCN